MHRKKRKRRSKEQSIAKHVRPVTCTGEERICKAKDMRGGTVHPVSGAKQLEIESVTLKRFSVHRLSTTPDI